MQLYRDTSIFFIILQSIHPSQLHVTLPFTISIYLLLGEFIGSLFIKVLSHVFRGSLVVLLLSVVHVLVAADAVAAGVVHVVSVVVLVLALVQNAVGLL